ncbi:MAG: rRNA pseudouridine synthase [candidate division Zixibacteria bacterium]|nr:rRNA pseudouridine synthase [candidate division Zixibacteria bacterium]
MIRINKYLSLCGVTSRRGADNLIAEGRVTLNDSTIEEQGVIIDETKDVVRVDGVEVEPVKEKVYVLLNKPGNAMTTLHDPFKRRTIMHYLKKLPHRVYPVGRLDFDTQGALLLTNDGDLAYRLAHPRYGVKKIYEALVAGHFKPDDVKKIKAGIKLDDGATGRAEVIILGFVKNMTRIRLTLTEGRKREVKQLCEKVNHPVTGLRRIEFAGISLKDLKPGRWRYLTDKEKERLKNLVDLK